jgi:hypothetical protein
MASSSQPAPDVPRYRIGFFYGPEPVEGRPGILSCTFNVKKRSWKGGVQIAVEVDDQQIARARAATGFESWLARMLSTLLDAERADYDNRARELFVQHLCALKLDLAIESGLQQQHGRIAAESFERELDAAVPARKDRLLAGIQAELDLAGYGGA